jgi:hypothetical protein
MKTIQRSLAAAAAALCMVGAHADTLFTGDFSANGAMVTPGAVPVDFLAGAGAGTIDFQLQGFNTLDGDNFYIDIFHLFVNGVDVFSATWDLGGGGADRVLAGPADATVSRIGRLVDLSIPVAFVDGANSVSFAYDSPTSFEGSNRAGPQGTGDEAWGLNAVTVNGAPAAAAVPEPETYALLLAGFGALGFVARRKGATQAR